MLALGEAGQLTDLASALAKVSVALGGVDLDVDLGIDADQARSIHLVRDAIARRVCVQIEYQSPWRDDASTRVVEPVDVTVSEGKWYVSAWCRSSTGWRTFRVDRMMSVVIVDEQQLARAPRSDYRGAHDGSTISATIKFPISLTDAMASIHGVVLLEELHGERTATIDVTNSEWLGALLCRFGGEVTVMAPPEWTQLGLQTARRMLARYSLTAP